MPIPQNFERAQLVIDGGDPIQCAFNPQEYSITKTNVWTIKPVTGTDTPKPEFGGGMPWTIRVQLLLDASLQGADASIKDDAIKLLKMMESGGGGGGGSGPPTVTFKWGSIESPKMVGSSLTIRFVMFRPNGEPARALVDLELTQSEQATAGQNPTTRAIAGLKVHTRHRRRLAAVGRLPELRRRHALAQDRRGQRDRQPVRRSAAAPSSPSRRSRPDAVASTTRPALQDRDRRRRSSIRSEIELRPRHQDHRLAAAARRLHRLGRLSAQDRGQPLPGPRRHQVPDRRSRSRSSSARSRRPRPSSCSRARSSRSSPTSRPAASRWSCAPTTARTG